MHLLLCLPLEVLCFYCSVAFSNWLSVITMTKRKALRTKRSQYLIEARHINTEMRGSKVEAGCVVLRMAVGSVSLPPSYSTPFLTSTTPAPRTNMLEDKE